MTPASQQAPRTAPESIDDQARQRCIVFDIETAPLPDSELTAIMPPFDPNSVRTGNMKDTEKIAAKIADSKSAYESDYRKNAALDPLTGRVLCIGLLQDTVTILADPDEALLLQRFWNFCTPFKRMIGFNIFLFDLPFLIRRSWKHGIRPADVRKGRYWSEDLVDLREVWQMGDRQAHGSLDLISKHFGVGSKSGTGKDFAILWDQDRSKAIEYVKNDLALTAAIAQRMAVV